MSYGLEAAQLRGLASGVATSIRKAEDIRDALAVKDEAASDYVNEAFLALEEAKIRLVEAADYISHR